MLSLNEYVKNLVNKYALPISCISTFDEYIDLNDFNEDTITDEQIDHYYKYRYNGFDREYVCENLLTHESKKLIEKINKKFAKYIDKIYEDDYIKTDKNIVSIELNNAGIHAFLFGHKDSTKLNDSNESKELLNIIAFFNYYVSLTDENKIYVEPLFTKPCLGTIKKYGGKIYHITLKANMKRILKLGILPKVGKSKEESINGYRYFPQKAFYIMNGKTKKDTYDAICETLRDKNLLSKEYAILEIDVSKLGLQFFLDEASKSNLSIYTMNAIDRSLITRTWYDINEFKRDL